MSPIHERNYEALRTWFEGREAIYVEQGVLRVRVSNIRRAGFSIKADADELLTPGLPTGRFRRARSHRPGPLHWSFGAGHPAQFSRHSWHTGYGMWHLYFAPATIQAVVAFAAGLQGDEADSSANQLRLSELLEIPEESPQLKFPQVVDPYSDDFRKSQAAPITVEPTASGWVTCPCCDMRFSRFDSRRWDGETHTSCGQQLVIRNC
jgi:hypothetical protein